MVEFKNVDLDHYFLTADPVEMSGIDAGFAGPGWYRTGYGFRAYKNPPGPDCNGCVSVSRFYGTPGLGPNAHFYTLDAGEAAMLKRPGTGWSFESEEFAALPSRSDLQCLHPVFRFYNNRWMFNDSNHRYVTNAAERDAMRAAGWIDEGIVLCALGTLDVPLKSFPIAIPMSVYETDHIRTASECGDETKSLGPCIGVNNLPVPATLMRLSAADTEQFFQPRTGSLWPAAHVLPSASAEAAARNVFVQLSQSESGSSMGIHVDTRMKGAANFSSVNPIYQMRTIVAPGQPDERFRPFGGASPFAAQLAVSFLLHVRKVSTLDASSHAYGHPTLEFKDQRSGRYLYFTVMAYGTVPAADFVMPDAASGIVIVGTSFRPGSPYGRSLGRNTAHTPPGYVFDAAPGADGEYEFRIDRDEFQRVLDAARRTDPALSADPADYVLDNYHFNNEVVGSGEIGITLQQLTLRLLRR